LVNGERTRGALPKTRPEITILSSKKEKVCGDCAKRLTPECPRCEYKNHELNLAACLPTDKACEEFSSFKRKKRTSASDEEKLSQADRLVMLALEEAPTLFHDQTKTPFARIRQEGVLVTLAMRSKPFKAWLANLLWQEEGKAPSTEAVYGALRVLEGMALFDGKEVWLYNRVAPAADGVWIDMCDERWRAIKVTANGWHIVEDPPILFRRYSHQKPLVEPKQGGDPFLFLDFINIPEEETDTRLVVLVAVISHLIPMIPHVILTGYGIQGSGKTMFFKLIRSLIDPSAVEVLTLPRDERERVQQLDHHWCAFYDNVTSLPSWMSDTLCRAATGGGFTKRELYTDDDDVIYSFRRCVGLNGINIAAQRGDLLDRSLLVGFHDIPKNKRRTEEQLLAEFEEHRPEILGGFLDVLAKAIQLYPSVNTPKLFRMADFTRWGCAIAMALGYEQEEFIGAYESKVKTQIEEAAHASPVATVLLDYMGGLEKWEGTPSELFTLLLNHAKQLGVSTHQKAWPRAPHVLVRLLNELVPSLKSLGCDVATGIKSGSTRRIMIQSVPSVPSVELKGEKEDGRDARDAIPSISSSCLTFDQILSGPHGLTGELWHKGRCAICGQEKTIEWHVIDFNRERHEICGDCAWRYSDYLQKKGEV